MNRRQTLSCSKWDFDLMSETQSKSLHVWIVKMSATDSGSQWLPRTSLSYCSKHPFAMLHVPGVSQIGKMQRVTSM
jgi:hypothetical protein